MVVNLFSQVRNKEIDIPIWREHPFDDEHFRTKWHIVPIKDTRNLHVTFPIPDLQEHYQAAVMQYTLVAIFHATFIRSLRHNNDMLILSLQYN